MKILHSSDLHLSSKYPERLEALEKIILVSKKENVDLVVIAGDFFDSSREADKLRPSLRDRLSSLPFEVLVIPGNHDYKAYTSDLNFGNNIRVLLGEPFEEVEFKDLKIIAVPYANQDFNDLVFDLKRKINSDKINILLIHCSLDVPFLKEGGFGDEERQLYLPVNSKVLAEIGFDYILAGHFHSQFVENKISDSTVFVYSGSPVSITRKETGKRRVCIINTDLKDDKRVNSVALDTFYYDDLKFIFKPGTELKVLDELEKSLGTYDIPNVNLAVNLEGFISIPEKTINEKIKKIISKYKKHEGSIEIIENYRDARDVLSDPLYGTFKKKLDKKELSGEFKDKINDVVVFQFSQARF
jgi:DNA repair exonuclease SbcCD nuclease subunit